MKNNVTQFMHPTAVKQIRRALWLARMGATKRAKQGLGGKVTQYVANRKGNNYLRIDVSTDMLVTVWGDCSRNITNMVMQAALMVAGRV